MKSEEKNTSLLSIEVKQLKDKLKKAKKRIREYRQIIGKDKNTGTHQVNNQKRHQLFNSEEELKSVLESSGDFIILLNTKCQIQYINRTEAGINKDELIGVPLYSLADTKNQKRIKNHLMRVLDKGSREEYETSYVTPTGKNVRYKSVAVPFITDKKTSGIIVNARDITSQKQVENDLKDQQEKLKFAQKVAHLGSWEWDMISNKVSWSDQMYELLGYSPGEVEASYEVAKSHVHPDDLDYYENNLKESLESLKGFSFENRIVCKDKKIIWVISSGEMILDENNNAIFMVGTVQDITVHKNFEQELMEKEEKLRLALDGAIADSWDMNLKTGELYYGDAWAKHLGYLPGEIPYTIAGTLNIIHPDDIAINNVNLENHITGNSTVYETETRLRKKDGEYIWILSRGKVIERDGAGNPVRLIGTNFDITNKKNSENELKENVEKLRLITENVKDVFWMSTPGIKKMLYVNPAYEKIWGRSRDSLYKSPQSFVNAVHPDDKKMVLNEFSKHKEGHWGPIEYRINTQEGDIRWILDRGFPIYNEAGDITKLVGVASDITDRKIAEAETKRQTNLAEIFLESMPCVALLIRPKSRKIVASNKHATRIGAIPGETCYESWIGLKEPCPWCLATKVWATGKKMQFEMKLNGSIWDTYWVPLEDDLYLHYSFDITDRKKAENALKESEEKLRNIILNSVEGISIVNENGILVEWNKSLENITGIKANETIGKSLVDVQFRMTPIENQTKEYKKQLAKMIKGFLAGEKLPDKFELMEMTYEHPDGHSRYLLGSIYSLKTNKGFILVSITRDITNQKNAELALTESESLQKSIFRSAPVGIGVVVDRIFKFVNDRLIDITGYSKDELIGKNARLIYPDRKEYERVGLVKYNQINETGTGTIETVFKRKNKRLINVLLSSTPIDLNDLSKGVTFTALDISERKLAEEALKISDERFRTIFSNVSDGLVYVTTKGKIIELNETALKIFGGTRKEIINKQFTELGIFSKDLLMKLLKGLKGAIQQKRFVISFSFKNKLNQTFYLECTSTQIRNQNKIAGLIVTVRDETERNKYEEEIKKSREQMRLLAANIQNAREEERTGIAREIHDELGQVLTAVKIDLVWLRNRMEEQPLAINEKVISSIALINDSIQTVKKISTELRPGILDDLGLAAAIEWQCEEFQKRTAIVVKLKISPDNLSLNKKLSTAVFRIFQEALTNVARHSRANLVKVSLILENKNILLEINDNGKGITLEQQNDLKSFGLLGISERTGYFGGEVNITGIKSKGTQLTVKIPLD